MSGGVRSYDIAHYLVENGHTVHMITSMRDLSDKDRWSFTNENGINVHWLSMSYSNKFSFLKRLKAFLLFPSYNNK